MCGVQCKGWFDRLQDWTGNIDIPIPIPAPIKLTAAYNLLDLDYYCWLHCSGRTLEVKRPQNSKELLH
jgi:hypothetical protein